MKPQFIFITCQIGAEKALKAEIDINYKNLKFSYSRPGFLTFKNISENELKADFKLESVFARTYGISFGKYDESVFTEFLNDHTDRKYTLHVWDRVDDEEKHIHEDVKLFENSLKKSFKKYFLDSNVSFEKNQVLNFIKIDENEWWWGIHEHHFMHSPFAGANPDIEFDKNAPSRAFLKLEEAFIWSNVNFKPQDLALDIGCSPGGTSYSLLKRGIKVIGIDPGIVDSIVFKNKNFMHIKDTVNSVLREDLPEKIDWLVLDMNVVPHIALSAVDRLVHRISDTLLGVFLTIKLNDWKYSKEIPSYLDHIKAMGMSKVRAKQLYHDRQEICVVGMTRKGLGRFNLK